MTIVLILRTDAVTCESLALAHDACSFSIVDPALLLCLKTRNAAGLSDDSTGAGLCATHVW